MSEAGFRDFRDGLNRHLDWFAERGHAVPVWWRDDDAIEPTPALERLLQIANTHEIEVALAVIPANATKALADRLSGERFASVLQHGYEHRNFQDKSRGEKAAEFGRRRDPGLEFRVHCRCPQRNEGSWRGHARHGRTERSRLVLINL